MNRKGGAYESTDSQDRSKRAANPAKRFCWLLGDGRAGGERVAGPQGQKGGCPALLFQTTHGWGYCRKRPQGGQDRSRGRERSAVKKTKYVPRRGDIIYLDFHPHR